MQEDKTLIIEESPWAYYYKHAHHIAPAERQQCQDKLAQLAMPHLHMVLTTSGVQVGRRHPIHRS